MRGFFYILIAAAILLGCSSLAFIWYRFRCFEWMPQAVRKRNLLALLPVGFLLAWWITSLNGLVAIVYLAVIWLICDGTEKLFRRSQRKHYYAGYLAMVITAFNLCCGYISCHRVALTHYVIPTHKTLGREHLRIALITDAHLGTTFNGDRMAEHMVSVQTQAPDILVIVGDLIDDRTSRNDWKRAAEALAQFKAPLGKYFVFGNHDRGYSRVHVLPAAELKRDLERSGFRVLQDESVSLTEQIELTGRLDRSYRTRKTAAALMSCGDPAHYRILLDHQPTDYAAEEAAGADLVLSGHTHGGQLWPLGYLSRLAANDHIYGHLHRGKTDFIVSSGISDWAISFKTGCKSEFVIIDVYNAEKKASGR